ncbi:phage capsid protein [Cupriavidus campinensis]|uniref:phage capsid protein n=1 Tax=Cupriavidus campinensis TaxID=151783 RepID=UPI0024E1A9AC|nr:phage capsid protein [Cupriavidus campinensis]
MSNTITNAFVIQWDTTIRQQAQQMDSRLGGAVTDRGNITGESFTGNRLAPLEDMPENTVRHGDTVWSEANHTTRIALMKDFYQALPVDRNDEPKLLANPLNGAYMQALIAAHNRRKDQIIFSALLGNSQAKDGTLVPLPSGQKIVAGGTAFTKAKLLTARKIFRKNEADKENGEELFIAYNSEMLEDILSDTTLTSADFLSVKMLQDGDVSRNWMGFRWIPYEAIGLAGGTYSTAAWAKSALHFGNGYTEGKASRRPDKKDLMQVSMGASHGATRVEEEKVVQIDFV